MDQFRVLIVEDNPFISLDLEGALAEAGCEVLGVAASETEALKFAEETRPPFAIVDIRLSPGDGRIVARALFERYDTVVLLATAHINDPVDLANTGAFGCLPKPYDMGDVITALNVVRDLRDCRPIVRLPGHMLALKRGSALTQNS